MNTNTKLRVAVFGCGRMGTHHVRAILSQQNAELVAVADPLTPPEKLRTWLPEEVAIYKNPSELLVQVRPDVVHVVTPPETHVQLARLALEHNAHVYVEKPFAPDAETAESVISFAREKGRTVCAAHQVLFQDAGRRYRTYLPLIGNVVHVESYFSFKTVRRAGSGLMAPVDQLMDILPHPVYLMLSAFEAKGEKLTTEPCELQWIHVEPNGEVRGLYRQGRSLGLLIVTLQGRPIESYLRIVGTNGSINADFVLAGVSKLLGPGTSAISAVLGPFSKARQAIFGTVASLFRLVFRKQKSYAGLAELVAAFYKSVGEETPSPVSTASILQTVTICEDIGKRLTEADTASEALALKALERAELDTSPADDSRGTVLVTGGTGFLGRVVVAELRGRGWPVRVIARRLPSATARAPSIEYVLGDISEGLPDELFRGVTIIAHLAAETAGGKEEHERNTIKATQNILDGAVRNGVKKFINISSIAVLKPGAGRGKGLNEGSPVDTDNLGRGPYVWAKAQAESLVAKAGDKHGIEYRTIRLGPLVDFDNFTPPGRLGREVGTLFVAVGRGREPLSVCDVHTASRVITHYVEQFSSAPLLLNLVEAPPPTRRQLVERLRNVRPELRVLWLPPPTVNILSLLLKGALKVTQPRKKPLDVHAAFASERYDTALASEIIRTASATRGSRKTK